MMRIFVELGVRHGLTGRLTGRLAGQVAGRVAGRVAVAAGIPVGILLTTAGCGDELTRRPKGAYAPELISVQVPATTGAGMPHVAAGPGGLFYVSWTEPTGNRGPSGRAEYAVRYATHAPDGAWSEPRTLARSDRFFVNWADFASIAVADNGTTLAAHWLERSGDGTYDYDIVVRASRDAGATWSNPRILNSDGVPAEHGFLSFFPEGDGFGAIWLDGRKTVGHLQAGSYGDGEVDAGQGASPAVVIAEGSHGGGAGDHGAAGPMTLRGGFVSADGVPQDTDEVDPRICECCQTSAAVVSDGAVAVYRGRTTDEVRDIWSVRRSKGRWEPPVLVHADDWRIEACPVNGPQVDAVGRNAAVAWFTGVGDEGRVNVAFSSNGGQSWDAPLTVDDGAPLGRVDVRLLSDGSALVVWLEAGEAGAEIRLRRLHSSGRSDPSFAVGATSAARASGFPRMARSGDDILLAWTNPTGTGGATSIAGADSASNRGRVSGAIEAVRFSARR